ncbi:P-loop containing nucleoside triphosphate hydrolase protein [Xylaria castorea]|nr:P-loop containing nucleoside triphosphate hydrolase protein [Xylaria castorea]
MSDNTSSFGAINSHNAFAGNHFLGPANITIHGPQDHSRPHPPGVYRSIPFPPNEDLVRRSDVARALDQLLPSTSDYQTAALWGLGGSGKTQVALAYAYSRCRDLTCSVFWVDADTKASFTKDYQLIARKLGLATTLNGEDLLRAVRERIEEIPNWVLVLDNADDLTLFGVIQSKHPSPSASRLNLNTFIPRGPIGTILWTSRDRQIAGSLVNAGRAIHILQMTFNEAETLLNTVKNEKTKEDEHEAVIELLAELDHLPLAISQAAAYMRRTSTSVEDYLLEIQRNKLRILGRSEYDQHRREQASNSVLETWDISVQYLRNENELTYDVLHSLAFVDNQNIPFDLIREAARLNSERTTQPYPSSNHDKESEDDNFEVIEVITRLCEFSFLSIRTLDQKGQKKSYDMHKLVQEAGRYRLQKCEDLTKDHAYFAKAAFRITSHLFPSYNARTWNDHIWERCEQYLAHAQQAGTWVEPYEVELEVARLLTNVFGYLYDRGRVREMEPVIKKAFYFRQKMLGEQHPDTIYSMDQLASTYNIQANYEEAEKLYRQVLHLREKVLGKKHPHTLSSMNDLGMIFKCQGKYEEAETLHRQTLQLNEKILGKKHPHTLGSINNLGSVLICQIKYEEAETLLRQTLQLREKILGKKHPDTLNSMNSLGSVLICQIKYEEAETLLRQMLQLGGEILGKKHPYTLNSMDNLGTTLGHQKKYEEAEPLHRQALHLKKEILGKKHPDTLSSMNNLGTTLGHQKKYEEAEPLYRQALHLKKEILGKKHPDTLSSMNNLSTILALQGKYEEAEKLYKQELVTKKKC